LDKAGYRPISIKYEDVVAGATIGLLSSFYFTTSYKGYEISPADSNGVYGFNINRRW
jgi:hypothetical protein